jgi:hypothetical protein
LWFYDYALSFIKNLAITPADYGIAGVLQIPLFLTVVYWKEVERISIAFLHQWYPSFSPHMMRSLQMWDAATFCWSIILLLGSVHFAWRGGASLSINPR